MTGGFGFTGSHLVNRLKEIGLLAIVYSPQMRSNKIIKSNDDFIFEQGDIMDSDKLFQVIQKYKPMSVVHLAALTGITRCEKDPQRSFMINVYGTFNVINACIKTGTRLIFISSREVYGETNNATSSENDPLIPNNVYGITKLEAENLVLWAHQKFGLNYAILRPTNLYGPGGDQYGAQTLIKKLLSDSLIQIFGGQQKMNFVFVEDVVDAIIKMLHDKIINNEILNIGSNDSLTINEFVALLGRIMGLEPKIEFQPMRKGETQNFDISIKKIEKLIGWKPKTLIEDGLLRTIDWYRKNN